MLKSNTFSGVSHCKVARHAEPSVDVRPLMSGNAVNTPSTASHVSTSLARTLDSLLYLWGAQARSRMLCAIGIFSELFLRKSEYRSWTTWLLPISRATECGFSTNSSMISFNCGSAAHGRLNILWAACARSFPRTWGEKMQNLKRNDQPQWCFLLAYIMTIVMFGPCALRFLKACPMTPSSSTMSGPLIPARSRMASCSSPAASAAMHSTLSVRFWSNS